jgi:non-specific serine/threonine protein kinase/serine/threonine-protein kinase
MKAEPASTSWFEDDASLEQELKDAIERRRPAPSIPGYEGLREIGQGGQGVVYVATQRGTRRRVAIKVLREPVGAAPEARRRFEREIDLAAGLHHPHIVSVYDGGATTDGRPYLTMEFIEGEAIEHCAAVTRLREAWSRPNLERVVSLFATVCDAVQHAHQRGVIHRDLKPSNIRVDSDGIARILDFGLAKAFGPATPSSVTVTEAGAGRFVGSLPWASPEQAAGRADAIDVRSDSYALGVILYQLLTGRFPYDVSGDLNTALQNIVTTPAAPPRRYVPKMDADLVTILLRALAKEPDRRYQSAGELAADLRAYLAREPISARRDSIWYLVRMTARRRKRTVVLAATLLALLAVSTVVSFVMWRDADEARDIAVDASETSTDALDLLWDSLSSVDPDLDGREARVLDVLERASAGIEERFGDKLAVRAGLHERFSSLYEKLGRPDRARDEALKAADLRRRGGGDEDPAALFAAARAAGMLHKMGGSKEAEPELARILEIQTRVSGPDAAETLETADSLGCALRAIGQYQKAETILADALARARGKLGPDDETSIGLLESLAHVRRLLGNLKSSEELQREAYERWLRRDGPKKMTTLSAMASLIVVLTEEGKLEEALPLQKDHYETALAKFGPDHMHALAAANTYAKILQDVGRVEDAAALMQSTFEARERMSGADHPETLLALQNLAAVRAFQGNYGESERLHRKALDARRKKLGEGHLDTLVSYNNLAGALDAQKKHEEARQNYERAAQGADALLGADHWISAVFRANLAATMTTLGTYAAAEPLLLGALTVVESKLGADHAHAKTVRRYLVNLYEAASRPADADKYRSAPASRP